VPRGLCIARHTTAYLHTPASKALTACCTAPPMFTVPTRMCQLRLGSFSIAIMQLADAIEMLSGFLALSPYLLSAACALLEPVGRQQDFPGSRGRR
jgi:hypothetical protein